MDKKILIFFLFASCMTLLQAITLPVVMIGTVSLPLLPITFVLWSIYFFKILESKANYLLFIFSTLSLMFSINWSVLFLSEFMRLSQKDEYITSPNHLNFSDFALQASSLRHLFLILAALIIYFVIALRFSKLKLIKWALFPLILVPLALFTFYCLGNFLPLDA